MNYRKLKITEMGRMSVEEFKEAEKNPLIIVLDNVRSLYNVGSVFRTCDAFRVSELLLCGITATPPHSEIHKTALGAEDTVEWKHFQDTHDAVAYLKEKGYQVMAIEQCENSTMLNDFLSQKSIVNSQQSRVESQKANKIALILGNEVKGVQQSVIDCCDGCIEIPQYGTKHSMNVSVTAGIVIYEFSMR